MAVQDVGRMLMGLSSGLQGRGNEFIRGQQQEQALKAQQQRQGRMDDRQSRIDAMNKQRHDWAMDENRRKATWQDALTVKNLISSGNISGAGEVLADRVRSIQALEGDPTQTMQAFDLYNQGVSSGDFSGLDSGLDQVIEAGYSAGFGKRPQGISEKDKAQTEKYLAEAEKIRIDAEESRRKLEALGSSPDIKISDLRGIRSDIGNIVAEPKKIRNAAARLDKISKTKSPTDQLAAVFTFMKALDPTSVVREGEQDQARSTGGISDQFLGYANRIKGEGALPPAVFDEMVLTAKRISNQAVEDGNSEALRVLDVFSGKLPARISDKIKATLPSVFESARTESDILNQYGIQ